MYDVVCHVVKPLDRLLYMLDNTKMDHFVISTVRCARCCFNHVGCVFLWKCSNTNFQVPVVSLALSGGNSLDVVSGLKSIVDDVSFAFHCSAFRSI